MKRCAGLIWELNSSRFFLGNSLVFQGRWKDLGHRLERWLDDARARGDVFALSSFQMLEARCVTLAAGDVDRARNEIERDVNVLPTKSLGVQKFLIEISKVQLEMYDAKPRLAVERIEQLWTEFSRSTMPRFQLCRIYLHYHSGFAYLIWAASQNDRQREEALHQASYHASRLEKESVAWATPFASYIRAAVANLQGDKEASMVGLKQAVAGFDQTHMRMYGEATRRRLGQLIGGVQGDALVTTAETIFSEQGVAEPARFASIMAPGFN